VDDSGSGGPGVFFTTENTEVTEALGSLASHSAGRRYYRHCLALGLRGSGLAAPPLPQSVGTDRNDFHRFAVAVCTSEPERCGWLAVRIPRLLLSTFS
jgi:hypothetical protein